MESYVGPELTTEQQRCIAAIGKNYPDGQVVRVEALHTADFTDKEDVPGGLLMIHPLSAKVHVDSIPLNAFTYMAVTPILSTKAWTDADFKGKEALIQEACPQFSTKPPSLRTQDTTTSLDGKTWNAELGEDENAFAGVFKQTKGRDTRYFIAAQAGAPMAVKQLRDKILKKNMTFRELLHDPDYSYAQYIAERNCRRLVYNVARAIKAPIRTMTDSGAKAVEEFSGRPKVAVPLYTQPVSSIQTVLDGSRERVAIFNKLTPVANAARLQFVYEGPYNGIAVFDMDGKGRGHALPAHSGRLTNAPALSAAEVAKRCRDVICEGDISQHPDMVADNFREVGEEEFLKTMASMGWNQRRALGNLVPVTIKVFSPDVRRQ